MLTHCRSGSVAASQMVSVPSTNEPRFSDACRSSEKGVFVGYSSVYSMPVFLDFGLSVNPHALIVGMTGSGKTYLMKNLMLKFCVVLGCSVVLIDFTGEYGEFAGSFGKCCVKSDIGQLDSEKDHKIFYFGLGSVEELQKIRHADSILRSIVRKMRKRGLDNSRPLFILLDEAWKLLKSSPWLEIIIREGRKYKVGLLLSSQLLEDSDLVITSNVATLFVFRTQDDRSIGMLARNYNLATADTEAIQNLSVGSYFLIRLCKSELRQAFCVKKFLGMNFERMVEIGLGENMELEIRTEKLRDLIVRSCGGDTASKVLGEVSKSGYIELWQLITHLIAGGADRHLILKSLRKIGVADKDIADAFAVAILSGNGNDHE